MDGFLDGKDVRDTNLTRAQTGTVSTATLPLSHDVMGASLEFVNFAVALLVSAVRYPSVLWFSNKAFSFMFSSYLVLSAIYQVISFCGFSILHKIHVFGVKNVLDDRALLLNTSENMIVYMLGGILIFFSPAIVFWYGVLKYNHSLSMEREKHCIYRNTVSKFQGYRPHLSAMAMLILTAACKGPLVYDSLVFYSKIPSYVIGMTISVDICYLMIWILLWFVLTVKRTWKFRIMFAEMAKKSPNSLICSRSMEKTNLLLSDCPDYKDQAKRSLLNLLHVQRGPNNNDNWKNSLKRGRGSVSSSRKYRISVHEDDSDVRSTPNSEHSRGINISGPIRSVFDTVPLAPLPHTFGSTSTPESNPLEEPMSVLQTDGWSNECENLLHKVSHGNYIPNVPNMMHLALERQHNNMDSTIQLKRTSSQPYLCDDTKSVRPDIYATLRKQRPRVPNYSRRSQTLHYNRKNRTGLPPTLNSAVEMLKECQFQNAFYYVPETAPVPPITKESSGTGYSDCLYDRNTNMRMTSFTDRPDFPQLKARQDFPSPLDEDELPEPDYTEIDDEYLDNDVEELEQNAGYVDENDNNNGEEEDYNEEEDEDEEETPTPPNVRRQRRDSANYSLTDSNGNDDSDHYHTSIVQTDNTAPYGFPVKPHKQDLAEESNYGYGRIEHYPKNSDTHLTVGSRAADEMEYAYRYSDCGV